MALCWTGRRSRRINQTMNFSFPAYLRSYSNSVLALLLLYRAPAG